MAREPTTSSSRFFDSARMLEMAMGFLFYLTLFVVMCVFGWSARGPS